NRLLTSAVTFGQLAREKIPFFALSLLSSYISFTAQQRIGAVSATFSLHLRLANALVSYVRYIGKMFWPENLAVLYPHPSHWPGWQVWAAAAVLLVLSALVLVCQRKRPYLLMG